MKYTPPQIAHRPSEDFGKSLQDELDIQATTHPRAGVSVGSGRFCNRRSPLYSSKCTLIGSSQGHRVTWDVILCTNVQAMEEAWQKGVTRMGIIGGKAAEKIWARTPWSMRLLSSITPKGSISMCPETLAHFTDWNPSFFPHHLIFFGGLRVLWHHNCTNVNYVTSCRITSSLLECFIQLIGCFGILLGVISAI